jgi:hypothetical protein
MRVQKDFPWLRSTTVYTTFIVLDWDSMTLLLPSQAPLRDSATWRLRVRLRLASLYCEAHAGP